jgi:hypothetical protein
MKKIYVKIFSKNILINIKYPNDIINKTLDEQFSYYETFSENDEPDLIINLVENFDHLKVLQRNPSIHSEIENGFIADFTNFKTAFYKKNGKLECALNIKSSGNIFFSFLRKVNNIEFATREERIAQILFESVLIPALFFDDKKILIHSSGFVNNNKGILIGGTGGSGKTSLELELCLNQGYSFTNDDIAVVNLNAELLPNLAHPKIYGYNLVNNDHLKRNLLKNRTLLDITQWHLKSKLFGSAKVRRRLFIRDNFNFTNQKVKLTKYFILTKEEREDIVVEKISHEKAVQLHLNVILAEYSQLINNIYWHEFNSVANNRIPILTYSQLNETWGKNSESILSQLDNYIIRIPFNIKHEDFLKTVSKLIFDIN